MEAKGGEGCGVHLAKRGEDSGTHPRIVCNQLKIFLAIVLRAI